MEIRTERVRGLTEYAANAEGFKAYLSGTWWQGYKDFNGEFTHQQSRGDSPPDWMIDAKKMNATPHLDRPAVHHFRLAWQSIYGIEAWDENPWVWVVSFRKVD